MVAVAGLVAHTVIGTARTVAAVELFIFKQELRSVDKSRIHLIIYRTRSEDMVDTPPLALITVSASDTILSFCSLRKIQYTVLTNLLEGWTIHFIIEIACNQNLRIGLQILNGINGLTKAISNDLSEGTAVAFAPITARSMNKKDMQRIA